MVDSLISNVEVISCYNIATQLIENEDEEGLLNVVETMFLLYLRVRSFPMFVTVSLRNGS